MNVQIKKSYIIEVTKRINLVKNVLNSINLEQFEDIKLKDEFNRMFEVFELMK